MKRAFQSQWCNKWQWLHYDVGKDVAYCHTCVKSCKIRSLGTGDLAFVSRGYHNWEDTTGTKGGFNTHQSSTTHKTAVELVLTLPIKGQLGMLVTCFLQSMQVKEKAIKITCLKFFRTEEE